MEHPDQPRMIHQHHIAFAPFCYLIYTTAKYLRFDFESINLLTGMNIIAGMVFLTICYIIFKRLFPDFPFAGITGALITGFSYTFGTYFRNSDQYIIPMTICAYILLRITRNINKSGTLTITAMDWIIFFIAVLMHQMTLLCLPAIAYAEYMVLKKNRFPTIFMKIFILLFSLGIVYASVFWYTRPVPSFDSFCFWMKGYSKYNFWVFSNTHGTIQILKQSMLESLFSHKALFAAPIERSSILRLHDYARTNGYESLGEWIGWILFVVVIVFIIDGFRIMKAHKRLNKLSKFLLIWFLPYFIFLQLFVPYQCFYRLFYLLPLIIFIMASVSRIINNNVMRVMITFLLICFVSVNLIFGFIPESRAGNNPYLIFSDDVKANSTKRDFFIMTDSKYCYGKYLRYFGQRDVAWLRRFAIEKYPDVTFEKVWIKSSEARKYLLNNYDNIYIPSDTGIPESDCLILILLTLKDDDPEFLLLFPQQLHVMDIKMFGDTIFYKLEIMEYNPPSYQFDIPKNE